MPEEGLVYINPTGGRPHVRLWVAKIAAFVSFAAAATVLTFWFVFRVEVNPNEILVLVNKTGRTLPTDIGNEIGDQVVLFPDLVNTLSTRTGLSAERVRDTFKGIRYEVLPEGRYFFNPYSYKRIKKSATVIGQTEVGVLVRRYGKPLPFPKTVATEANERGPVAEVLRPGRYNVNPFAYRVQKFPAAQIPEGHVGVVTLLSGPESKSKNTYTVEPGEKGVQRETLPPGLEYYNPYLRHLEVVDLRSHKYDLLNDDTIHFPSNDSFTITIEGTIEWAIRPDHVAEVAVAYGDQIDILEKIIIPNARSVSRIQGSKLRARDFIGGKTRTAFQEKFLTELKRECWSQGIDVKAALVRDIQVPTEIASLIGMREQADQEIERSTNQMEEARAEARLVEQRELQDRNKLLGDARRDVVTLETKAEQRKAVAITKAYQDAEVAKLNLEAAEKLAAAVRSRGEAEAKVILFEYQAKAEPLQRAVGAFGDGTTYAQQFFLQRVAPSIQSILSNTEGPFADIFRQFQTFTPAVTKGGDR